MSSADAQLKTGSEAYKSLENGVFVGAGHFVKEKPEETIVEYKISKVVFKA